MKIFINTKIAMKQEAFAVEQFMDKYETGITNNMGETCVESLTVGEIVTEGELAELTSKQLTYGAIRGSAELKQGISELYETVKPEDVVVTNGAIGGNFLLFYSVAEPGKKVVVVTPSYQQLASVPQMFGAEVIKFPLSMENGWLPDLDKLNKVLSLSDILVVNNPNNPTGIVWDDDLMKQIVELCKTHDVLLFCDEVYRPLYHSTTNPPRLALDYGYDNVVVSGSMSKAFSLAGLRVGWVASHNQTIIDNLWEKRDYNTISILMVDDYLAAKAIAKHKQILTRNYELCKKNLSLILEFVARVPRVLWVKPTGGSTCFIRIDADTLSMCKYLAEYQLTLVVPGEVFEAPGFVRIGFGNLTSAVSNGLLKIEQYLARND